VADTTTALITTVMMELGTMVERWKSAYIVKWKNKAQTTM